MVKDTAPFNLPDFDRLSTLGATIMLAYILSDFINVEERSLSIGVFNLLVVFRLNTALITAVLTAGMAVSGTAWLLHGHPAGPSSRSFQHWALPGLTAWVLAITISSLSQGLLWWLTLFAGSGFLVLVWIAEYITLDPADPNFRTASSGLTALAFALYLALTINLRAIGTRLLFLIPAASLPVAVITARYLALKLQSQAMLDEENRKTSLIAAGTLAAAAGQLVTTFHFLPLNALSFGLALLSPIYSASIYFGNLVDGRSRRRTIAEAVVVLAAFWLAAAWAA